MKENYVDFKILLKEQEEIDAIIEFLDKGFTEEERLVKPSWENRVISVYDQNSLSVRNARNNERFFEIL